MKLITMNSIQKLDGAYGYSIFCLAKLEIVQV